MEINYKIYEGTFLCDYKNKEYVINKIIYYYDSNVYMCFESYKNLMICGFNKDFKYIKDLVNDKFIIYGGNYCGKH